MSVKRTDVLGLALVLLGIGASDSGMAQGRGQGAIVIRDDATIYASDKGEKIVAKVARGYAVGGITVVMGMVNSFVAETENGRCHILYLGTSQGPTGAVKGSTEKNALRQRAWMNSADLAFFTYECGCGEKREPCAPVDTAGWISERWNPCFAEARDKKLAELKVQWAQEVSGAAANEPKPTAKSSSEKPLTSDDVIGMVKAGLGDELTIAKINQAPAVDLDVSADALVRMKKAGASKAVIDAVMKRASQSTPR